MQSHYKVITCFWGAAWFQPQSSQNQAKIQQKSSQSQARSSSDNGQLTLSPGPPSVTELIELAEFGQHGLIWLRSRVLATLGFCHPYGAGSKRNLFIWLLSRTGPMSCFFEPAASFLCPLGPPWLHLALRRVPFGALWGPLVVKLVTEWGPGSFIWGFWASLWCQSGASELQDGRFGPFCFSCHLKGDNDPLLLVMGVSVRCPCLQRVPKRHPGSAK